MRSWTIVASTCLERSRTSINSSGILDWSARWIADAVCPRGAGRPDCQRRRKVAVQLRIRDVDGRRRRNAEASGIGVPDQPDNLEIRSPPPDVRRQVLADGALVGKVPRREDLVDDCHGRTPRGIAIRELPSRHQSNPHRREEAGSRADEVGVVPFRNGLSRGNRGLAPHRSAQRRVGGKARCQHTRETPHILESLLRQRRAAALPIDEQHSLGTEARIEILKILQRADEEAGAGQQNQRERHLRDDERRKQFRPRRARPRVFLERRGGSGSGRLERGDETEHDAGRNRHDAGEAEDMPVRRQIELQLGRAARNQVDEKTPGDRGQPRCLTPPRRATAACFLSGAGARFVPGRHRWPDAPPSLSAAPTLAPGAGSRRSRRRSEAPTRRRP